MYDNIGGKIKTLAEVSCWIGIIASVITGIALMPIGIIIMIAGSLVSWISSFALYGLGQLIENTDAIVESMEKPNSYKGKNTKPKKEKMYTEEQVLKDFDIKQKSKTNVFLTEIKETPTDDLILILQDQKDLYNEEEIQIIENELKTRY